MDKEHGCGCAGGLGGGFELESPQPVMSTRGQDICWHLLLGPGQAAGFRAPARASYQACVKPPCSLASETRTRMLGTCMTLCFWSRPSGAAFMRTLWIVNLLRGHELVFYMVSALNASTREMDYATMVFFCVFFCMIHLLRSECPFPLYGPDLLVEKSNAFTHRLNSHSSWRSHRCIEKERAWETVMK